MTIHADATTHPKLIWDITYQGAHTNIFVKKMERFLQVKTQTLERERYVLHGKKLERAVFQHYLKMTDWDAALVHTLSLVRKVATEWLLTINDAERCIKGKLPEELHCGIDAPSGLHTLCWTLTREANPALPSMAGSDMW